MGLSAPIAKELVSGVTQLVDQLYTTDEEKANAKLKFMEMIAKGDIAQLGVNTAEAQNSSLFVSGWRPAVGWVCVTALGLNFLAFPVAQSIAVYIAYFTGEHIDLTGLPRLDFATLGPILMGMLGLGSLRTVEKVSGVARQ